eukprot:TRINITY_DN34035_c0_g1_i1.p1 TRINITY_DN34035_c0_g1~~TRINITY_DN34035_c0_g1_i1.p1  ORF type:complete len:881 (-),score=262.59 TRINITY_DN34035_c0_g1_i1:29-2356(-)
MDTVLNLGLNDKSVEGLTKKTGNARFAWDSYRRFIQMFSDVVMELPHEKFEDILDGQKKAKGAKQDVDLTTDDLKEIVNKYKALYKELAKADFPQDPVEQMWASIGAVFGSWNNKRAIAYRKINNIFGLPGTAVTVMSMVFGNMGENSGTGVAFSRNPSTGDSNFIGEFLLNAQGEDVVAGIRTPLKLTEMEKSLPEGFTQLKQIMQTLEKHYKDMQDIEFTIQEGKVYMLQCRNGKRTAPAALKIAIDMLKEGLITEEEAIMRIEPTALEQLLHKQLDPVARKKFEVVAKGLPASPGAGVGVIIFDADKAKKLGEEGKRVVLVRKETSPKDIEGMYVAAGILTARGGITSHAAVVCRAMGKCCVAGCMDLEVDEEKETATLGGKPIKEGDFITLDGSTGEIYLAEVPVVEPKISGDFEAIIKLADKHRRLHVRANCDTPEEAKQAREFGAQGIGLVRTEHMFFDAKRITSVRRMILAETTEEREKYLEALLPYQRDDFCGIFKEMTGLPVVIRLLDPPLHEFLPKTPESQDEVAKAMELPVEKIVEAVNKLAECNPMLGFRGCRLGVKYPEISKMQAKAVFLAALEAKKQGFDPKPWIEVPLVGNVKEYLPIRDIIEDLAKELGAKGTIDYKKGCMIEVPRAALTAHLIAKDADFLSFGTNDLTQMTLGFSRDDVGKFIGLYVDQGIYNRDPFVSIDQEGVGQLMEMTVKKAKEANPKIEIGICGEQAGEADSVDFCHRIGLNDISPSPFRVPVARLAAAQAAIREKQKQINIV